MSEERTGASVRHKTFTYRTDARWLGDRSGLVRSEGKPDLRVSSPPEFKGQAGMWTPEDLFVAALDLCTMTTFTAFAQHRKLEILSYQSSAEGTLEFVGGSYRVTRVLLRPRIMVADPSRMADAEQALHDAHASCIVANSIQSSVSIEAVFGPTTSEPYLSELAATG